MHSSSIPSLHRRAVIIVVFFFILILVSTACGRKTPTPIRTPEIAPPTPTARTLPPALVETEPLPGSMLALRAPITFYFNQPMDRASVEGALHGEPALSGRFTWRDDSSLTFTPDSPLLPGTSLAINISTHARSARGMALLKPVELSFATSDYLKLTQQLPSPDTRDVAPTSAVVAAFNQPVVALGADPASLPVAFTLSPSAQGYGEWLNTSTYIFYPQPALAGGTSYDVELNPDLVSTAGSPLETASGWSFHTILPRLVYAEPIDNSYNVHLDATVRLDFSYAMDSASVEENFALRRSDGSPVSGDLGWNDGFTTFIFTPTALLERGETYSVLLGAGTAALGGTTLDRTEQVTFHTVSELSIYDSQPSNGGTKGPYESIMLYVTSIINTDDIRDYVTFTPSVPYVNAWMDYTEMKVAIYGTFDPDTEYTLTVSPDLVDLWGDRLGQAYTLRFRVAPSDPDLSVPYNTEAIFLTTRDRGLLAQATNLDAVRIAFGTLSMDELVQMYGSDGWQFRESFTPADADFWTFYPDVPPNRSTTVTIPVSADGEPRSPGLYFMRFTMDDPRAYAYSSIVAISRYHATMKMTNDEVFVWVVDLETGNPAADMPVSVYNTTGARVASGTTDDGGIFQSTISQPHEPYSTFFAILGTYGEDDFGFVSTSFNDGLSPWDFNIGASYSASETKAYVYTDRPIYRPGDTVHFRLILRNVSDGRYTLPDVGTYQLALNDTLGEQVTLFDLSLSGFGTAEGEYTLPSDALPGTYSLLVPETYHGVYFDVANYRKPDINLQVEFQSTDVLSGTDLVADVSARYFFDAPAGNLPLQWTLYSQDADIHLPNYQVGPLDMYWLGPPYPSFHGYGLGNYETEGKGQTDASGMFTVEIPAPVNEGRRKYVLEVTLTDESGLPVSARDSMYVNPAPYYIGVHPDAWSFQADMDAGFDIQVVDWDGEPAGGQSLAAKFQLVEWVREDPPSEYAGFSWPMYVPQYTFIASTEVSTTADGKARLEFTPPGPGTYQLDVSGDGSLTQVLIWVAGRGRAAWPALPNQQMRLVPDRNEYKPGDTANVFVPNPFGSPAMALLTIERGSIMRYQTFSLEPGGTTLPLALSTDDAPNVYVSVTLLGEADDGSPDFRQGYVNLPVDPSFEFLNVDLTSQPERLGPGEPVTFSLRITDASGSPVEGEFSLSVVDLAVLALADPNSEDIFTAFYGNQNLGVRLGIDLAASGQRIRFSPGGMGGGGGDMEAPSVTRENFPDTAYWNAEIVTDANGQATVSLDLPDTLTTWQVLVRGLTRETLVGEAQIEVITTRDLLVRPVTPRFLVMDDHALLAAVVQNNTSRQLQGSASLQANGFILDDPNTFSQPVTIPPNGRVRVEWWGTAEDVASASLRFSVRAGDLEDAVLVARGALPVLRYTAPQVFATSGTLFEAGERLELVSLPVTYDATRGSLVVELDPSLAAAMLDALDALENYPYDCTEQVLSRFLPNLVTYTTLQSFAIDAPDLKARLDRTLEEGLRHLLSLQNSDGGWGWWQGTESDTYISAYVLFGLAKAREAGFSVPADAITKARSYISSHLITPGPTSQTWQLDRLAFQLFALDQSGSGSRSTADRLYQVRDQLSPWAKGLLVLSLDLLSSSSPQVPTLVSDLQSSAIRSSTGVHWEADEPGWHNMTSTLTNSAIVLYTLAKLEPASTLLPDAVNYIMSNRQASGYWSSTYETAWILIALNEVMKGTGELTSNYAFSAYLNGSQIAIGEAGGATQLNPVTSSQPISQLYPHDPNDLVIQRGAGTGRLYYTAALQVYRPVEDVAPLDHGISVNRHYYLPGADLKTAEPVGTTRVGETLTVRLTLSLPTDAYHLVIEDYIPAGTEILNTSLKTTRLGAQSEVTPLYDPHDPYRYGWGWWLFNAPRIFDDHISWTVSYLPAGTYELTYTLVILQAGEYRLLPARAWMFYFPEVQGTTAGGILEIKP